MIYSAVMDELGEYLRDIPRVKVKDFESDDVDVPCALIQLPYSINYLTTMGRGTEQAVLYVTLLASLVNDRKRRNEITAYADATGTRSVREALEGRQYKAFDTLAVESSRFTVVTIAGVKYVACVFKVNITGSLRP